MALLLSAKAPRSAAARLPADEVARLVERAAVGDQEAWDELVDEFAGLVWAVARAHRLSDADAADVAQTAWLRLVEHLDRLKEPGRVGAWLATTTRRECLRVLRRPVELVPHHDDLPLPNHNAPGVDAALLAGERDAALWTAFARLGARDQALLRLLVADPAPSYQEIGAALDTPIGSIGPTRSRALAKLRREAERVGLAKGD